MVQEFVVTMCIILLAFLLVGAIRRVAAIVRRRAKTIASSPHADHAEARQVKASPAKVPEVGGNNTSMPKPLANWAGFRGIAWGTNIKDIRGLEPVQGGGARRATGEHGEVVYLKGVATRAWVKGGGRGPWVQVEDYFREYVEHDIEDGSVNSHQRAQREMCIRQYERAHDRMSIGHAQLSRIVYTFYKGRFCQVDVECEGEANWLALGLAVVIRTVGEGVKRDAWDRESLGGMYELVIEDVHMWLLFDVVGSLTISYLPIAKETGRDLTERKRGKERAAEEAAREAGNDF